MIWARAVVNGREVLQTKDTQTGTFTTSIDGVVFSIPTGMSTWAKTDYQQALRVAQDGIEDGRP